MSSVLWSFPMAFVCVLLNWFPLSQSGCARSNRVVHSPSCPYSQCGEEKPWREDGCLEWMQTPDFSCCASVQTEGNRFGFLKITCKLKKKKKDIFVFIKSTVDQCRLGVGHFKSTVSVCFLMEWNGMEWNSLSQLEKMWRNAVVGSIWYVRGGVGLKTSSVW